MTDVHVATHPSGHPNKTAVNPDNPIFARPADPVPAVSVEQAAVVQSDKGARETVISPLINEDQLSPASHTEDPAALAFNDGSPIDTQPAEATQDSEPSVEEPATEIVEETPVEADPADPVASGVADPAEVAATIAEPASAEA